MDPLRQGICTFYYNYNNHFRIVAARATIYLGSWLRVGVAISICMIIKVYYVEVCNVKNSPYVSTLPPSKYLKHTKKTINIVTWLFS